MKPLNKDICDATDFTGMKTSTAKQQSKSAFSLKKPSGGLDDAATQVGQQTMLQSQHQNQGPPYGEHMRLDSQGQRLVTLDLQKHSASIFHPPKNFDSTLNTDERRTNATALSHAMRRTRELMVGRHVPLLKDIMPAKSGQIRDGAQKANKRYGLREDQDQFYMYSDRQSKTSQNFGKGKGARSHIMVAQRNEVAGTAEDPRPLSGFMQSTDTERNRYYECYAKDRGTKKKLQIIQDVALENELVFNEKTLMHQLRKNAGHDYKLKKYLQSLGVDDGLGRSSSSGRLRSATSGRRLSLGRQQTTLNVGKSFVDLSKSAAELPRPQTQVDRLISRNVVGSSQDFRRSIVLSRDKPAAEDAKVIDHKKRVMTVLAQFGVPKKHAVTIDHELGGEFDVQPPQYSQSPRIGRASPHLWQLKNKNSMLGSNVSLGTALQASHVTIDRNQHYGSLARSCLSNASPLFGRIQTRQRMKRPVDVVQNASLFGRVSDSVSTLPEQRAGFRSK